MKKLILIFALIGFNAFSQSLSIFNIDSSTFPTMKAKFYAFDAAGNQILNLSASDFSVTENGLPRTVSFISCPPKQPQVKVSVAMSIDISGSMSRGDGKDIPVELGKTTAKELVNVVAMPPSEFALQVCHATASILNDFTTDKNTIINKITPIKAGGDNNFVEHLLNPRTGILNVAKTGRFKRIAVLYTDAWWYALTAAELQRCKDTCSKYGIQFYAIVYTRPEAEPNGIKKSLKELAAATGGILYDGIVSATAAKDIGNRLQQTVQGGEPCELNWISGSKCLSTDISLNISIKSLSLSYSINYKNGTSSISRLVQSPAALVFRNAPIGVKKDTVINIKAVNSDFDVTDIQSANAAFSATPKVFSIKNGETKQITVSYTAADSGLTYTKFSMINNQCGNSYFYASGGYLGIKSKNSTLKLTFPNGGETFVAGSDSIITWDGISPTDEVKLEYSSDNGANWQSVRDKADNLNYFWSNIPNTPSTNCLMKVSAGSGKSDSLSNFPILTFGDMGSINSVAYSPDGKYIAVGTGRGIVAVLDAVTLNVILSFKDHANAVNSVAFSADGMTIVSGSTDKTIKIWDLASSKCMRTISETSTVLSVTISSDGKKIGSTLNDVVKVWDVSTGQLTGTFIGHKGLVKAVTFSPDGTKLASAGGDNNIMLWDVSTGAFYTLSGHSNIATCVTFSADGTKLASGSYDMTAKLWDVGTRSLIRTYTGHSQALTSVSMSPDGSKILTGSIDGALKLWNTNTGAQIKPLTGHSYSVLSVALNPVNNTAVSGSADNTVKLWDISTGNCLQTSATGHTSTIYKVAYSPDGTKIASASGDQTIKLWDAQSGVCIKSFIGHTDMVNGIAYSPDGKNLASGSSDYSIKLWDISTGNCTKTLDGHLYDVLAVSYSADGKKLVSSSSDNTIKIWDLSSGTCIRTIPAHNDFIFDVCFNSDGSKLLSASDDSTAKLWDAASGQLIRTFKGHTSYVRSAVFSPDEKNVLTGSGDKTMKLWDLSNANLIRTFTGHTETVRSVAFTPDYKNLISGSWDKTIKVWDINTGKTTRTLIGHTAEIYSIRLSGDGSKLASAGDDEVVFIWEMSKGIAGQEDVSDAVWSIVFPQLTSIDLDMGKELVGNLKDSVVKAYIKNVGTYPCRIDSVSVSGADASQFIPINSGLPLTISAGDVRDLEMLFKPTSTGLKKANILIYTQSKIITQNIIGEAVQPALQIMSNVIDFGKVHTGYYKDTVQAVLVKNIGTSPINILSSKLGKPNNYDFSIQKGAAPLTISAGQSMKMDMRFKPSTSGRTSGQIEFEYNGIGSPAIVQLFGQGYDLTPNLSTNSPICLGDDLKIYADSFPDAKYKWIGPDGFSSTKQNVLIKNAKATNSGKYTLFTTFDDTYIDSASVDVIVSNQLVSPGDSSYMFVGSALREANFIKLTSAKPWDAGSIWLKNRFSVKQDFSTNFQFRIRFGNDSNVAEGSIPGADGIAFVMQNHNYPVIGDNGGSMGYTGINNSLAIEFDMYKNVWEDNGNHIAVQSMGAKPNQPDHRVAGSCLGITDNILTMKQDSIYYAKIEYNWANKTMKIFLDSTGLFVQPQLIINNIDLTSNLQLEDGEYVYIGFSAGTGSSFQEHDLFNWTIPCKNQLVEVKEYSNQIDVTSEEISIVPNPAKDGSNLIFNLKESAYIEIKLISVLGQENNQPILKGKFNSGQQSINIDISGYSSGIYIISIKIDNKMINKRLVIIK